MNVDDEGAEAEQCQQGTLLPEVIALGLEGFGDVTSQRSLTFPGTKLRLFAGGGAHAVPLLSSVRILGSPAAALIGPAGVDLRITGVASEFTRTGSENRGFLTRGEGSDS